MPFADRGFLPETQAVAGALTRIAFNEGALGPLDQSVIDLFPERKSSNVDAKKKAMTPDRLLDSTSTGAASESRTAQRLATTTSSSSSSLPASSVR